ncbi:hypothetical protein GF342_02035 [Candidatus Woesearchaeota archaeon]|nr:hypothetical protein [Candidatus Woesearchaeota archaeon]
MAAESSLLPLLIILFFALVIPEMFKRFHIPFMSSIILVGAILGPYGLGYVASNDVIEFFGFLGMTFLMFMAGLETDISQLRSVRLKIIIMAGLNGLIPFGLGVGIAQYFGYSWMTSLLLGTIFVSSSVAVVVPALESAGLFRKVVGQLILASILVLDILSLILLAIILQRVEGLSALGPAAFIIVLLGSIIGLLALTPHLAKFLLRKGLVPSGDERPIRAIVVLFIAVLAFFSAIGVHPILAAFLVGIPLAPIIRAGEVYTQIHTLGYGLFIPVFFFVVGMQLNFNIFLQFDVKNMIMLAIVFGLILSKFLTGFFGGLLARIGTTESTFFGIASTIQITTTLAVTFTASTLGIFDSVLVTSILLVSVITTIIAPLLLIWLSPKVS